MRVLSCGVAFAEAGVGAELQPWPQQWLGLQSFGPSLALVSGFVCGVLIFGGGVCLLGIL